MLRNFGVEPSKTRLRHEADTAAWMRSEVSASNPACVRAVHRNNQPAKGSRLGLTGSGTERIKRSSTNCDRTQDWQPELQVHCAHVDPVSNAPISEALVES
jgi:hypothetical protein